MRGMDLDHLRPSFQRSLGRFGKGPHDALDSSVIQFGWNDTARGKWQRARGKDRPPSAIFLIHDVFTGFPGRGRARFPACMRELQARKRALVFDESKDAREHFDLVVFPESQIFRTDASFRKDCRCFRHDERGAADGTAAKMHEMPVIREAVDARILAHGRNADAVPQTDVSQFERSKQMRSLFRQIVHGFRDRF